MSRRAARDGSHMPNRVRCYPKLRRKAEALDWSRLEDNGGNTQPDAAHAFPSRQRVPGPRGRWIHTRRHDHGRRRGRAHRRCDAGGWGNPTYRADPRARRSRWFARRAWAAPWRAEVLMPDLDARIHAGEKVVEGKLP